MKSKYFLYPYISLLVIALSVFLVGCDDDDKDPVLSPSVVINKIITTSSSEITVLVNPNETVSKYVYAIGSEEDRDAFIAGTLAGIKEVDNNEEQTIIFSGLAENTVYTIFVRAYGADNVAGPVASVKAKTRKPLQEFLVERQYLTENSVAFNIEATRDYYKYVFGLGKDNDLIDFEDGTLEGIITKEEISKYTASYFNLDENTEYVFFIKAYDRLSDEPTEVRQIKIKTEARGVGPSVSFKIDHIDMFSGEYTFTPNEHCGKISVASSMKDTYAEIMDSEIYWKGDIRLMLERWTKANNGLVTIGEEGPLQTTLVTSELLIDNTLEPFNHPLEAFVLIYDKNNEPYAVQKFEFYTPLYNDNAKKADVELKISNITNQGAFYEFIPNEHTMGIVFETFDAEWYQKLLMSDDYYDGYIEDFLHMEGYWNYCYKVPFTTMPERTAEPGKTYYVFYMAMNVNGPYGGWSDLKFDIYRTKEDNISK